MIRTALIRSLAQTHVRTRSSPRTQAGRGDSPPANEVAFPDAGPTAIYAR
jgi:hypothetical protein